MNFQRKVYKTGQEKLDDYSLGVAWFGGSAALLIAWFVMQTMITSLPVVRADPRMITVIVVGIAAVADISGLIFFSFTRKWVALGILSGMPVLIVAGAFMAMVMFG